MNTAPRSVRILLIALLSLWLVACSDPPVFQRYVAVIDSGSSGSRIYLYERSEEPAGLRVRTLFTWTPATSNPLSGYESNPDHAGPLGVQPLLDALEPTLSGLGVKRSQIKISLLATAGMRLVEQRDASVAAAIYASARRTLSATGMSVGRVETLSGLYEGVYSWADVNYLRGNLDASSGTSVGIVEVGGASAQIAYISASASESNVARLSVNGRTHRVFSVSWLGLGQNEARGAMIARPGGGVSANPCYANNSTQYGGLTQFDAGINGYSIAAAGSSFDAAACSALYDGVLGTFNVQSTRLAEFSNMDFVGVSSIFYVMSEWKALSAPATLMSTLTSQCVGLNAYGSQVEPFIGIITTPPNVLIQNACANGTYIDRLLFGPNALNINAARLSTVNDIAGQSLTWTRGFALTLQ